MAVGRSKQPAATSHRTERVVRLETVLEIAENVGLQLQRTQPADIQKIADWLNGSPVLVSLPVEELVELAKSEVDFSACKPQR